MSYITGRSLIGRTVTAMSSGIVVTAATGMSDGIAGMIATIASVTVGTTGVSASKTAEMTGVTATWIGCAYSSARNLSGSSRNISRPGSISADLG